MVKVTTNNQDGNYVLANRVCVELLDGPTDNAIKVTDEHTGNYCIFAIGSERWEKVPSGLPNLIEVSEHIYNWLLNEANRNFDEVTDAPISTS